MKVQVIASGSKGNSCLISNEQTNILIDIGITLLRLKSTLEEKSLSLCQIDALLITHSHNDHIKGLAQIIKKTNIKVYIPEEMYHELQEIIPLDRCIFIEDNFNINDIEVELIHTSHDTDSSVGYIISSNNKSVVYVTDTGYINRKYLKRMENKDAYVIESNHDEVMLMDGPYPRFLKERVISDRGHLSNNTTSTYLKKIVGDNTKYIVLAHISEKNNTKELAYEETRKKVPEEIEVIIAEQYEETKLVEV